MSHDPRFPGAHIIAIHGKTPQIHDTAFIAPGAVIIGDVVIGAGSSIWYNCVVRADVYTIRIGERTNVQDGSVLHCDPPRPGDEAGCPLVIGDDVLIGHMAMVHGCTIHDRGFVGLGAIVMNKAVIGSDAMLAAGAMLTERKVMGERELWAGRPAVKMKDLSDAAIAGMRVGVMHYAENAKHHAAAVREGERVNPEPYDPLPPEHPYSDRAMRDEEAFADRLMDPDDPLDELPPDVRDWIRGE